MRDIVGFQVVKVDEIMSDQADELMRSENKDEIYYG